VDEDATVPLPEGVAPEQAAAMGVAGVTAFRTVTELGRVGPDDRVLVLGAGGGVGGMVVSLARSLGATVWGQTGDAQKADLVRRLGAAHAVVAGDAAALAGALADFSPTVVFDALGDGFTGAAIDAMAPRGRLVLFGTSAATEGVVPLQALYRKGLSVLGYGGLIADPADLRRGLLAALEALAQGRLEVTVDAVVPLEAVNDAFDRLAARRVAGKLVLDLRH
jgi:NADPH2:quinone reductase